MSCSRWQIFVVLPFGVIFDTRKRWTVAYITHFLRFYQVLMVDLHFFLWNHPIVTFLYLKLLSLWGPIWYHIHGNLAISEFNEFRCENDLVVSFFYVVVGSLGRVPVLCIVNVTFRWGALDVFLSSLLQLFSISNGSCCNSEVQRTQKNTQWWKRKKPGEFCVMLQEYTSSHFHQQNDFLKAVFYWLPTHVWSAKCSAAGSGYSSCAIFLGMQGIQKHSEGHWTFWIELIWTSFYPGLFFQNHSGTYFCCRHWNGTSRYLLQDQQIHWATSATPLNQDQAANIFTFLLSLCFAMWCRWLTHWRRRCKMRNSLKNSHNMGRLGSFRMFFLIFIWKSTLARWQLTSLKDG